MTVFFTQDLSKKDISILLFYFLGTLIASFLTLTNYPGLTSSAVIGSNATAIILQILVSFNMSYIMYLFLINPKTFFRLIQRISNRNVVIFTKEILTVNILSLLNILFSLTSIFFDGILKNIILSISFGIMPVTILFLLSMDGFMDGFMDIFSKSDTEESSTPHHV